MNRLSFLCTVATLLCGLLGACKKDQVPGPASVDGGDPGAPKDTEHKEGADHKDEVKEHEELPSRVRLPDNVIAAAKIRTEPVGQKQLPLTVDLTGEVAADPDRSARVAARVPGRVVEVRFKEGERVKAGALLATLESPEVARVRAAFLAGQVRAEVARRNAERLESLAKGGLSSGQEVQAAQAEARSIQAEAQAAQRTLQAYGLSEAEQGRAGARFEVRAPVSGAVAARDAIVGQTVGAEHVLGEIVDLDQAYFLARLFEKNLGRVRVGETTEVRLNAYPSEVFLGTVETIGTRLDPAARTVIARIAIKNRDNLLKVGLFGTARVTSNEPAPHGLSLVVPLGALTRLTDKDVVFVRQADGHFEVHPVTLGRTASGQVEILRGLRAGEQVVVEGAFTLKSNVLKSTFGEED